MILKKNASKCWRINKMADTVVYNYTSKDFKMIRK